RPNSTLAGDELVAIDRLGHEDRLDDAVGADALGEGLEGIVGHAETRLARGLPDPIERDLDGARRRSGALRDGGGQASAKPVRSLAANGHQAAPAIVTSRSANEASARAARVGPGAPETPSGRPSRRRISAASSR